MGTPKRQMGSSTDSNTTLDYGSQTFQTPPPQVSSASFVNDLNNTTSNSINSPQNSNYSMNQGNSSFLSQSNGTPNSSVLYKTPQAQVLRSNPFDLSVNSASSGPAPSPKAFSPNALNQSLTKKSLTTLQNPGNGIFSSPKFPGKGTITSELNQEKEPSTTPKVEPKKEVQVPTGEWESPTLKEIRSRVVNTELATTTLLVNSGLLCVLRALIYFLEKNELTVRISSTFQSYNLLSEERINMVFLLGSYITQGIQLLLIFNICVNGYRIFVHRNRLEGIKLTQKQSQLLNITNSPKVSIVPKPIYSPPKYMKSTPESRISSPSRSSILTSPNITGLSSSPMSSPAVKTKFNTGSPLKNNIYSAVSTPTASPLKASLTDSPGSTTLTNLFATPTKPSAPSSPLAGLSQKLNSPSTESPNRGSSLVSNGNPNSLPGSPLDVNKSLSIGNISSTPTLKHQKSTDLRRRSLHAAATAVTASPGNSTADTSFNSSSLNLSGRYKYLANTPSHRHRIVRDI